MPSDKKLTASPCSLNVVPTWEGDETSLIKKL